VSLGAVASRGSFPDDDSAPAPKVIRVIFRSGHDRRGLLGPEPRLRTLRKVLVTYPEVRHILPDRVSLVPAADAEIVATMVRFLERQHWLVTSAVIE
jgi:hypothetical protein